VLKSPVWEYFVPGDGLAKCMLCKKVIKRSGGNTSNLLAHLRTSHRDKHDIVVEEAARRKSAASPYKQVSDLVY